MQSGRRLRSAHTIFFAHIENLHASCFGCLITLPPSHRDGWKSKRGCHGRSSETFHFGFGKVNACGNDSHFTGRLRCRNRFCSRNRCGCNRNEFKETTDRFCCRRSNGTGLQFDTADGRQRHLLPLPRSEGYRKAEILLPYSGGGFLLCNGRPLRRRNATRPLRAKRLKERKADDGKGAVRQEHVGIQRQPSSDA